MTENQKEWTTCKECKRPKHKDRVCACGCEENLEVKNKE